MHTTLDGHVMIIKNITKQRTVCSKTELWGVKPPPARERGVRLHGFAQERNTLYHSEIHGGQHVHPRRQREFCAWQLSVTTPEPYRHDSRNSQSITVIVSLPVKTDHDLLLAQVSSLSRHAVNLSI